MDVSQFCGGPYLSAAQLPQPSQVWTIRAVTNETVKGQPQIAVSFQGVQKPLLLNKTNLKVLAQAFGNESDSWLQQLIEVYEEQVTYEGRPVPGIRVRILPPPAQQATTSTPSAAASQPQPVAAPQPPAAQAPAAVPTEAAPAPWAGQPSQPPAPWTSSKQ